VGLANARALTNTETQEFLLLFFAGAAWFSLHGAFRREGRAIGKKRTICHRLSNSILALQWFPFSYPPSQSRNLAITERPTGGGKPMHLIELRL